MNRINFFTYSPRFYPYLIFILAALFFFPLLGYLHLFDWDEINFAESSREMMVSGDYFHVQINYMPFWEKPPLFMWLQSSCMQIFGVNEFASRLPNALFGIITLLSLYTIGKKHMDAKFGLTWSFVYLMSFLPHIYFKSGIIDPIFNYFIFMSIYFLVRTVDSRKLNYPMYSGIFAGLAILTKGPVGLLLVMLTYIVFLIVTRFRKPGTVLQILIFTCFTAAVSIVWVIPEIMENGFSTLGDFIAYQYRLFSTGDAGHEQPFFYHPLVVFIGCFPMSVFSIPLLRARKYESPLNFTTWMMILFWVVMIVFTIVKTKIVHYSSMCWLPMSFCAAWYIHQRSREQNGSKGLATTFLIFGMVFSLILTLLPLAGYLRQSIIPYVKDKFAVACMQLEVNWQPWLMIWGIGFGICIILGFRMVRRGEWTRFLSMQTLITGITLLGFLITVVPKIERHSQGPAIDFYKAMKGKNVYVFPLGFKTYAHYFYFEVPPTENLQRQDEQFLLYGDTKKPVYLITKANSDFLDQKPQFKLLKQEGGFKFYMRMK